MRKWMQALGFGSAVAVAPAVGGAFALGEAIQDPDVTGLRKTLRVPSQWSAAAARPRPQAGEFAVTYRIPLWVRREDSNLRDDELAAVLAEINTIWAQAGICFEMGDADSAKVSEDQLVLRFIGGGDDLPVYGMYDGHLDMWTHDRPDLAGSPHGTEHPAARTASHELGHALSLGHYSHHHDSLDSLMASGRRGYRLHPFEIARARYVASRMGEAIRASGEPSSTAHSESP